MRKPFAHRDSFALVAVVCCVVASAGAVSCGSDEKPEPTATSEASGGLSRNTLRSADIEKAKSGTAERAFLEWWQAVQFQDLTAVRDGTVPSELAPNAERLDAAVRTLAGLLGKPRVLSERRVSEDLVTLRTTIATYAPDESNPTSELPYAFDMQRVDGAWRVADLTYLFENLRNVRANPGP